MREIAVVGQEIAPTVIPVSPERNLAILAVLLGSSFYWSQRQDLNRRPTNYEFPRTIQESGQCAECMANWNCSKQCQMEPIWNQMCGGTSIVASCLRQVIDFIGEPWRNRTSNLLIKSQLLCQLS